MVESKKAFPKEPRSFDLGGMYANISPPINFSPGRYDNVNNNVVFNKYGSLNSHYYNNQIYEANHVSFFLIILKTQNLVLNCKSNDLAFNRLPM